ncbi:transposase [Thermolongibacillus altinsuensis]|uniref:Transposase n=1 Tax=Thermolongibacillus altinsuensis TaxID=575256 RepID=A0A4R1QS12_9BACL|nr:IS630 family transposase [Thermolongibacillus altinsuensis]TCL52840.1 transposase [Thermolongibacillus altinsuensis]
MYEDESHIRDYQALHATWSLKGKQKQVLTYGHHATVSLFGALNVMNGEFLCMEAAMCNAQWFQQFLEYVLSQYPKKNIVILKPFLEKHRKRLTLLFLPPYSPNLNLCERIWKWMKESVIVNHFHATREEIRESIISFLEYIADMPENVLQRVAQVHMSKA